MEPNGPCLSCLLTSDVCTSIYDRCSLHLIHTLSMLVMLHVLPTSTAHSSSIVHDFFCCLIDYCNSILVGLPKVCLSPLQSVHWLPSLLGFNSRFWHWSIAGILVKYPSIYVTLSACLPSFLCHFSSSLHLIDRHTQDTQIKMCEILKRGTEVKWESTIILPLIAWVSRRTREAWAPWAWPLIPRTRTSIAKTVTFAIIGPTLWNSLTPLTCFSLSAGEPSIIHSFRIFL